MELIYIISMGLSLGLVCVPIVAFISKAIESVNM